MTQKDWSSWTNIVKRRRFELVFTTNTLVICRVRGTYIKYRRICTLGYTLDEWAIGILTLMQHISCVIRRPKIMHNMDFYLNSHAILNYTIENCI